MMKNKVLMFGVTGAVGCLLGCLLGQGLLEVGLPEETEVSTPSLVARPEPPVLSSPDTVTPEVPGIPELPVQGDKANKPPPPEFSDRLKREGGQQFGDVRITLIWNDYNDLDLHCIDPNGEEISFTNKRSVSRGELDVDENVTPTTDRPVENIYWPKGKAPDGRYRVLVNYYNHHRGSRDSPYKVNISVDGQQRLFEGTISDDDLKRQIHTFTLGATVQLAAPEKIEVYQGSSNRMQVKIARERFDGPVTVRAEGDLDGISVPEVTIPEGKEDGEIEVTADADTDVGDRMIRLIASAGDATAEVPVTVTIKELSSILVLAAPESLEVNQGGSNQMTVLIARSGLDGAVTVHASQLPTGVTIEDVTLGSGETEARMEFSATPDAATGTRTCRLVATSSDEGHAETTLELKVNEVVAVAAAGWSWSMVLLIGLWTALLTIGLALALVAMQNRYLRRPLFDSSQLLLLIGGAAFVGFLSGGTGQGLLMVMTMAELLPTIGFVIGWMLLGGLLGYGLSYFIPNLHKSKSSMAGAMGGLAGSLAFVVIANFAGDIAGRFLGTLLLGLSIGLMVALVELAFRQAWVEVRYGSSEIVTVNLGPEPVKVGSDSRACAIYAANALPIAFRYWLDHGKVFCEDIQQGTTSQLSANESQEIGAVTVTVRAGSQAASTPGSPSLTGTGQPRPIVPPPPRRKSAASPPPSPAPGIPDRPAGHQGPPPPPPRKR